METIKFEMHTGPVQRDSALPPIRLVPSPGDRTAETSGFKSALRALGTAYAQVAAVLDNALEYADADLSELSEVGACYAWISERRRLVKTFLESEPAILAYANSDCACPDQIRSLAEAASELAGDGDSFASALALLEYIDHELGWANEDLPLAVV